MEFYYMIKNMSDEELKKTLENIILSLEKESREDNDTDVIGYKVDYNPVDYYLNNKNTSDSFNINMRCFYNGYVPTGMKVVYGIRVDNNGIVSNEGMYYVVDDDSYIFDFCKYIRGQEVDSEMDLFEYILIFLKSYFGVLKDYNRDDMFQMILKDEKIFHSPVFEHKLSKFKKQGNAMCSEYSIMAGNILSVFGIDNYLVIGHEKDSDKDVAVGHAFNIVSYEDYDGEVVNALIDFANSVDVYDFKYNKLGDSPYIMYLDELNEDIINDFIYNDLHFRYHDYDYMVLGNSLLQLGNSKIRDYFVSSKLIVKNDVNEKQKRKNMI